MGDTRDGYSDLFGIYVAIALAIFAVVVVVLAFVVVRFRSKSDELPRGRDSHPLREASFAAVITVIVAGLLAVAFDEQPALPRGLRGHVRPDRWRQVAQLARTGVASPLTTSVGRLFDAVAALCGLRAEVNYEGQAAVELEAVVESLEIASYPLPTVGADDASLADGPIRPDGPLLVLDARSTVRAVVRDLEDGVPVPCISAKFHNALAAATATACERAAARYGTGTAVLSGGVFQNRTLLQRTAELLRNAGLRVLTPELLPANDGGTAYGQLAVASARLAAEGGNGHVRS